MNYYNEIDPLKAEVLREAIKTGAIAPGDVDERSISDVRPADLAGYAQCHFFAGGGFWSLALRNAGWPDDRPVWTGSCPCPSFSAAGKGEGFDDPRHLWPDWFKLIRECRPPVVFGEQADAAVGFGWVDLVQTDMEAETYAFGKVVFGAHSVRAPHIRQRLYFVADTHDGRRRIVGHAPQPGDRRHPDGPKLIVGLGDAERARLQERLAAGGDDGGATESPAWPGPQCGGDAGELADTGGGDSSAERQQRGGQQRLITADGGDRPFRGYWDDADWIPCRNPKVPGGVEWRPIEPGTFPLAHGSTARVGRLRLYGDAIVVSQAQVFIEAYLEARGD